MKKIVALVLCTMLLVGLCFALTACGECKHTYGEPQVVEPTCTEDGKYVYTCTKCGESLDVAPEADEEDMLKTGHTSDDGTKTPATCTTDGSTVYKCVDCEVVLETEPITAPGHARDLGTITTAPTCTEAGVMTFKCTNYGCSETLGTEPIDPLGHNVDGAVFETDGTNHYNVCTVCEMKLNTTACSFALTAADAETHAEICTVCNGVKGEPVAHTFGAEQTVEPSATTCAPGKVFKVCSVCEYEHVISVTPGAMAHTYAFDADASVLDEVDHEDETHSMGGGVVVYTCATCGDSYQFDAIAAVCFDNDCPCGFTLDFYSAIKDPEKVVMKTENGEISIVGAINAPAGNMTNNLDVRLFGAGSPMLAFDGTKVTYVSFDIRAAEGGFPEWGVQTIYKCNGAWVNLPLTMKDGMFTLGDATLELDTTVNHNVVISVLVTPRVGVEYNVWVDGVRFGTTHVIENPLCDTNFSNGSSNYGGLKVDGNGGANFKEDAGFVLDNVVWTQTAPAFAR